MKKIFNMKRIVLFVCIAVLSLGNIAGASVSRSDFVLLIYMNGSNLESESKLATGNIRDMLCEEMPEVRDNNLTILLLMGGTCKWHLDESMSGQSLSNDSITYAKITRRRFPENPFTKQPEYWRSFYSGRIYQLWHDGISC